MAHILEGGSLNVNSFELYFEIVSQVGSQGVPFEPIARNLLLNRFFYVTKPKNKNYKKENMEDYYYLIYSALFAYPVWRIFSKTGKSGYFALFLLIPIGFIIILYVLAFSKWPLIDQKEGD